MAMPGDWEGGTYINENLDIRGNWHVFASLYLKLSPVVGCEIKRRRKS